MKHQFLILNQEILSNGYRNTQTLPREQERILNYRNGIRAQIIRESRLNEVQFFNALQVLYGNTKIPLLTAETSLILFKKYVRNKDTFRCFEFLSKQLDKHPCVEQAEFWTLVIQEFYMTTNGTFENQKFKLTLYVDIVKALYKKSNIESYRYLVKYVLNQSDEAIQYCLQRYGQLNYFQFHRIPPNHAISVKRIVQLLQILKKKKAPSSCYELLFIQLMPVQTEEYKNQDFKDFFTFFYNSFSLQLIPKMNYTSYVKLYNIFKLNPNFFNRLPHEAIEAEYWENANKSSWNSQRVGEFGVFFLEQMCAAYGIARHFANAYWSNKISEIEFSWMQELVKGRNLSHLENLPCLLTKKMAHAFNHSTYIPWPSQYPGSITELLIKTALMAETDDAPFVDQVVRRIRNLNESTFWIKTMSALHRNGLRANSGRIDELFDYIQHQVFVMQRNINFSTKKISNLMREVQEWHQELIQNQLQRYTRLIVLPDSGLDKFKIEYNKENYVIKQLKTNRELILEGQTLKHCVGGYTNNCILRGSFIFSLRKYFYDTELDSLVETPLITIEVNKNRILQKKGTRNRACNEVERFIINEWRREFNISAY